ncbi:hypothetical protein ACA910_001667 [Epithemia clementina (nom. ined.)]
MAPTPGTSSTSAGTTGSATVPLFVYEQEIPEPHIALERAYASLRQQQGQPSFPWQEQLPWSSSSVDSKGADKGSKRARVKKAATTTPTCGPCCRHIQEYLPLELELEFGVRQINNTNTISSSNKSSSVSTIAAAATPQYSLWLCRAIHALHFSSQGLCELTKSAAATAKQQQQQQQQQQKSIATGLQATPLPQQQRPSQPLLYGDEQERQLALSVSGLHPLWHANITSFPTTTTSTTAAATMTTTVRKGQEDLKLKYGKTRDSSLSLKQQKIDSVISLHTNRASTDTMTTSEQSPPTASAASKPATMDSAKNSNKSDDDVAATMKAGDSKPEGGKVTSTPGNEGGGVSGIRTTATPKQGVPMDTTTASNVQSQQPSESTARITQDNYGSNNKGQGKGSVDADEGNKDNREKSHNTNAPSTTSKSGTSSSIDLDAIENNDKKETSDTAGGDKGQSQDSSKREEQNDASRYKSLATSTIIAAAPSKKDNDKDKTNDASGKSKSENPLFLLEDSVFQRYQKREDNVRSIRRALLGKRSTMGAPTAAANSSKMSGATTQQPQVPAPTSALVRSLSSKTTASTATLPTASSLGRKESLVSSSTSTGTTNKNIGNKKKRRRSDGGTITAFGTTTNASGTTKKSTSSHASNLPLVHLTQLVSYQLPLVETKVPSNIAQRHQQVQERVARQVERWMAHYRLAADSSKNHAMSFSHRSKPRSREQPLQQQNNTSQKPISRPLWDKSFVFGAIREVEEHTNAKDTYGAGIIEPAGDSRIQLACPACRTTAAAPKVILYCLYCGYVGCREHMRQHMVLQQHWLGVTVSSPFSIPPSFTNTASAPPAAAAAAFMTKRLLYCFHCDEYCQHVLFLEEEERLALDELLPWMAWDADDLGSVQRSFDPLRFVKIPDIGIFWNGFHATYPISIPHHHIQASRICRLRRQLVELPQMLLLLDSENRNSNYLSSPFVPIPAGTFPNNSHNRNRGLVRELVSVVQDKIRKPVGMYNLGHTCFQSAVFQCLVHCQALQTYFLQDVGHASHACQVYRNYQSIKKPQTQQNRKKDAYICLACDMDHLFLHYQSRSSGINVFKSLDDLAMQSARAPFATVDVAFDPLSVLRDTGDGAVVERVLPGEPLVAHKDLLASTWNCPQMAHLSGYDQRDAHEFLHAFLESLGQHTERFRTLVRTSLDSVSMKRKKKSQEEETASTTKAKRNVIQDIFEGTLRSVLLCQECGGKRVQKESFLSISLDLSKEVRETAAAAQLASPSGGSSQSVSSPFGVETRKLSVEKCLYHFTAPEELVDPVDCPLCMKKTTTKKQLIISHLPPVVCLHLKRFQGATGRKLEAFVSFPARDLNMGTYLPHWCEDSGPYSRPQSLNGQMVLEEAPPQVPYRLFATVNHYGNLQSGHYVSYVKIDDQWYHCNDSHVSYTTESHVLQQGNAYLLFYERDEE